MDDRYGSMKGNAVETKCGEESVKHPMGGVSGNLCCATGSLTCSNADLLKRVAAASWALGGRRVGKRRKAWNLMTARGIAGQPGCSRPHLASGHRPAIRREAPAMAASCRVDFDHFNLPIWRSPAENSRRTELKRVRHRSDAFPIDYFDI